MRERCPFGITWAGWLGQANAEVAGCANCTVLLHFALGASLTQLGWQREQGGGAHFEGVDDMSDPCLLIFARNVLRPHVPEGRYHARNIRLRCGNNQYTSQTPGGACS